MGRCDDGQAMGKRRLGQLIVQERDDRADPGEAKPDRQIIRLVRHQQADHVALLDVLCQRPTADAVDALCQRTIGQRRVAGQQCGRFATVGGDGLDDVRQQPVRLGVDRGGQFQRSCPGVEHRTVAGRNLGGHQLSVPVRPVASPAPSRVPHQWVWEVDISTILPHRVVSAASIAANSVEFPVRGMAPSMLNCALMLASFSAALISRFSSATMSGGAPFGAPTP